MRISVLDSLEIPRGFDSGQALRNAVGLAQLAEELDLPRYWVVEHHGFGHEICPASDILVGAVAAATRRIRVGVGGVLLNRHDPYRIAQASRTLAALYPGRIDIGLGRSATGLNAERLFARNGIPAPDDHPKMVEELLEWLSGKMPADIPSDDPFGHVPILPDQPPGPMPWLLAASTGTAELAGRLGLPLAASGFHKPEITGDIVKTYAAASRPGECLVALIAIAAPTQEEAERLALPLRMVIDLRMKDRKDLGAMPSFDEAKAYFDGVLPATATQAQLNKHVIGSFDQVAAVIRRIGRETGVDEVMIRPLTTDLAARAAMYRALSRMVA